MFQSRAHDYRFATKKSREYVSARTSKRKIKYTEAAQIIDFEEQRRYRNICDNVSDDYAELDLKYEKRISDEEFLVEIQNIAEQYKALIDAKLSGLSDDELIYDEDGLPL